MLRDEIEKIIDETKHINDLNLPGKLESLFEKHKDDFAMKFVAWKDKNFIRNGEHYIERGFKNNHNLKELLTEFKTNHYKP